MKLEKQEQLIIQRLVVESFFAEEDVNPVTFSDCYTPPEIQTIDGRCADSSRTKASEFS